MSSNRRDFLTTSARAGAALSVLGVPGLGSSLAATSLATPEHPASHPLRILILGGTAFLGPHQIAYALGRGHSVSIFTRGQTQPTVHKRLFDDVEQLVGDRDGDLGALGTGRWDAVIDNSGREVAWTKATAELLRDRVDRYVYTSSTGVYYPYLGSDIREDTPVLLEAPQSLDDEESLEYGYGVMKANSELAARTVFGDDRTTVIRPTYIMGPGDRTNRFIYWPVRLARGGEVLVPGKVDDPVQYIDVRDVAEWSIRLVENAVSGTFNAAGPAARTGMLRFVHGAHSAFASPATFVQVDDYDFLTDQRLGFSVPWIMPTGNNYGSARANIESALSRGLTFRPLADSVRDLYQWWQSDAVTEERRTNLSRGSRSLMAREPEILAAWQARG